MTDLENFKLIMRSIADLAMPRICVVCGRKLLMREEHICTVCEADLPLTLQAGMRDNAMARSYNELIQRDLTEFEPFSYAASLFFYRGEYRRIPQALKYKRNFAAGRHFGRMLGRELAASPLFRDVDLVVPVPLHWRRRLSRGYNQAEIIARAVAKDLPSLSSAGNKTFLPTRHVAVAPGLLERRRRTRSQAHLRGREERFANVRSAFCVPEKALRRLVRQFGRRLPAAFREGADAVARPMHILLIDDVYTTGATLAACHRALRSALGPTVRISAATLASVGE